MPTDAAASVAVPAPVARGRPDGSSALGGERAGGVGDPRVQHPGGQERRTRHPRLEVPRSPTAWSNRAGRRPSAPTDSAGRAARSAFTVRILTTSTADDRANPAGVTTSFQPAGGHRLADRLERAGIAGTGLLEPTGDSVAYRAHEQQGDGRDNQEADEQPHVVKHAPGE